MHRYRLWPNWREASVAAAVLDQRAGDGSAADRARIRSGAEHERIMKSPLASAPLSAEEIRRYKRHLLLKEVGGPGQQRLKDARVLVIGAGGLGSPLLMYLAAAGVGHIGIADDDCVSLDNLQRQIVHDTAHIGEPKTGSAAATLGRLNPHVAVEAVPERITADNALGLIGRYDIVADGSDNFATRYLVNDACYLAKRPLVFAALGRFDGYLSTFRSYETGPDGNPRPSYRCIFPEAPPPGTVPACEEAGILGAVAGVIGTLQAVEVLKELLGLGESLCGRLLIYDALAARFETINAGWDPENPLNGRNPTITDLEIHRDRV
jgi:adenylyltransferase/sulfurtransferase